MDILNGTEGVLFPKIKMCYFIWDKIKRKMCYLNRNGESNIFWNLH